MAMLFAVAFMPLCVLTLLVGLPAAVCLSFSDSWSQLMAELAASRARSDAGASWSHRFPAGDSANCNSLHPVNRINS
jgi:hypothetical protein